MEVLINYKYSIKNLDELPISKLAHFVLSGQDVPENTQVSVSFVTNEEIANLNETYRKRQGPTDVLSFECDSIESAGWEQVSESDEPYCLGDIIIAPDVALAQTKEFGTTFEQEINLLVVHGLLHLCGYDHIEEADARVMEALEDKLLNAWDAQGAR